MLAVVLDPQRGAREQRQLARLLARARRRAARPGVPVRAATQRVASGQTRQRGEVGEHSVAPSSIRPWLRSPGACVGGQRGHQLAGARPQRALARGRLDVVGRSRTRARARARRCRRRAARARRTRSTRSRRRCTARCPAPARSSAARARQRAAELVGDRLRAGVQVARARVVAEARPTRRARRRAAPSASARTVGNRAIQRSQYGITVCDARLLQHDLADPDRVRIARAPPRQVAAVTRVVRDDRRRDGRVFHAAVSTSPSAR